MPWAKQWRMTMFAAVVSVVLKLPTWEQRRTQKRHIERAALWCGMRGDDRRAEHVAEVLAIGVMVHRQARAAFAAARDLRARAEAVGSVLEAIPSDERLCGRLLRAGQLTGGCGQAWWWDEQPGYRPPFQPPERPP